MEVDRTQERLAKSVSLRFSEISVFKIQGVAAIEEGILGTPSDLYLPVSARVPAYTRAHMYAYAAHLSTNTQEEL